MRGILALRERFRPERPADPDAAAATAPQASANPDNPARRAMLAAIHAGLLIDRPAERVLTHTRSERAVHCGLLFRAV
jgi:hypothetical protein